ncbi:MAG: PQQ-dependent sugar dehydrogenase [Actinomycetota bacterium]|nr:PQQ-dependent sugar dehydrogenase [Actinomycetota bacterium]
MNHPARSRRTTRLRYVAAPVAAAAVLLGVPAAPVSAVPTVAAKPDPRQVSLSFDRLASGLANPVAVVDAPDGGSRRYVVERRGTIKIYNKGNVRSKPYLDIRDRVNAEGGEQGLLGLAFHPNFSTKPVFWVTYTRSDGALRLARFRADSATARRVDASTGRQLLTVPHPTYTNHNAGQLLFNRDWQLYLSTGDGGGGGDPFGNAQDKGSLSGKILRINPHKSCGGKRYCIPQLNPYKGATPGRGEIWLRGLRNVWRFSADRDTGKLWLADVGQNAYEEVTRVGYRVGGRNLGWSCREGFAVYDSSRCTSDRYKNPTLVYGRDEGQSITGGFVYRGLRYRNILGGLYVFADFISGRVWTYGNGVRSLAGELGLITAFGETGSGELLAVTYDGNLYRVKATPR